MIAVSDSDWPVVTLAALALIAMFFAGAYLGQEAAESVEAELFDDRFLEDLEPGLSDRYGPVDCAPLKWSHRFECVYANNQSQRFELAFVPVERDRLDVTVVPVRWTR